MLPAPRVPDGLTITPFFEKHGRTSKGAADYIPDNGICERFHKTVLNEFHRIAFRKKVYRSID